MYIRLSKALLLYTTVDENPFKVTPSPDDTAALACAGVGSSVVAVLITVPSDDIEL